MGRNALKIVCNPYNNEISYFFKNEKGVWTVLSSDSPLSRKYYTNTTLKDRGKEIVEIIDKIYNRNNKGLDILLEGTTQDYDYLKGAIDYFLPNKDIVCTMGITRIAVMGKTKAGKTCLIEGMEDLQGNKYTINVFPEYIQYCDERGHVEWYEINGIDFGVENLERSYQTISKLVEKDLSALIYCVNLTTGRLEEIEHSFLLRIIEEYPSITVLLALTMSIKANYCDVLTGIEKMTKKIKVIPVLAKEYEIELIDDDSANDKRYIKKPFGLETLSKYAFERR